MSDVMVDIETLGTKPGSLILSIGAVRFDKDGLHKEFYRNVEALSSLMAGFTVDPDTVRFWNNQPFDTRAILFNSPVKIEHVLFHLTDFIHRDTRVWAKGPDFDLVMLQAAYEKIGERIPWSYRNTRDVRTILDIGVRAGCHAPDLFPPTIQKHSALEDAKYQANQVITVYNKLNLWLD